MPVLYALIFLLVPAGIIWLTHHQPWAARVGVILLCYLAGLVLGNLGLVPDAALGAQQGISELTVALALPMLLFTLDIRQWRHVAGRALLSMLFATVSVTAIASLLFFQFGGGEAAARLAGMAVGVYTGGTPNLAAIKAGLDVPHAQYIVFHSVDTLVGAAYLMAMLTVGIPIFRRLLPAPGGDMQVVAAGPHPGDEDDYRPLLQRDNRVQLLKIAGLSVAVLAVSFGLSQVMVTKFSLESGAAVIIIFLTSFGIVLSLLPQVRGMVLAYRVGMYLVYIFCFTVASMAKLEDLLRADMAVVIFVAGAVAGSVLVHALLCKLAGVDSDTFMVTSVAAVASPPFVPLIARSLGNPALILSGMTTGIIGYALGNYLGISLALVLQG